MTAPTRIGDVLLEAYPFKKLRAHLKKASEEVEKAAADRSEVDDAAFAGLIERQDSVVAQLAARGPASGDEAIFLLRILRDRMDADFDSSVIEAANRDIVRGVTDYLSDTMPRPHNGPPLVKTDWRKLLDEYRRLARAENTVAETYPDPEKPPLSTVTEECVAIEVRISEAPVDGLESIIGKLALIWATDWANVYSRSGVAIRTVLDFLAEQTGWDPYILYDREAELVRFSKEEIAEAAALYPKKPDKNDDGPIAG